MPRLVLPDPPLHDDLILLREWRESDAQVRVSAGNDEDLLHFTSVPAHPTEQQAVDWIHRQESNLHTGMAAYFAVTSVRTSEVLGSVGLIKFCWEHERAEVGYWILAPHRGHGIATRALRLLCGWAFRELKIQRLDLFANLDNIASQRVAIKARFVYEGTLRSYSNHRGGRENLMLYSRLPQD